MRSSLLCAAAATLLVAAAACNRVETTATSAPSPAAGTKEAAAPRPAPPAGAPNLLLVTIDTLRADHVGVYGAGPGRTPTLDALAARGVLFENAFSSAPLTLPSHATILTGLYPPSHGVRHNGLFVLDEAIPRLPQRLQAAGWATGAVVAAMVLDPRFGLDAGFDAYDAELGSRTSARGGYLHRTADRVTDAALAWLDGVDRPFFLWVHYFDPHGAYEPPEPFASRFAEDPYAGEIAFADAELGRLLAGLEADGRLDDTLVVVTADHGESLGEHGEVSHSYTVYDATQHVPMILAGPGLAQGRRVPEVVSTADLAPTLLARLDLPALPRSDGEDLAAALAPGEPVAVAPDRAGVYAETLATRLDHGFASLHAVRSDRWLWIEAPRPELYDVREDPGQTHDLLAAGEAEVPPALPEALETAQAHEQPLAPHQLDAETRAQLQALGYALPAQALAPGGGMDPKDGLPLAEAFERANALYFAGHAAEAERIAAGLADALPDSPRLHHLLALIYLTLNQPADAERHLARLLEIAPESAEHHLMLGYAKLARGDVAGAVGSFEHAAHLEPDGAREAAALMWRAARDHDAAAAEAAATHALEIDPDNASVAVLVGDNWERLGFPARALAAYQRAVSLDPRSEQGHVGMASAAARLGRAEQAEQHLEAAGEVGAGVPARMRVAIAYAKGGDAARAEALLRSVVASNPELEGPRQLLAGLLDRTGRAEEATQLRETAPAS